MPYKKVKIIFPVFSYDMASILIVLLAEKGFESFVEITDGFEAYIQTHLFKEDILKKENFPDYIPDYSYSIEEIPPQNWNEYWEKNYYSPIVIDNQCVVRGSFHNEFPNVKYQIIIEPKMSFGTGHHETTEMMIRYILETDIKGKKILDMGCGSGILGILAVKKGAEKVTAIDIDNHCVENSYENCSLNNIKNMNILQGDASILKPEDSFDVIFANINRNILLEDIPKYNKVLKSNGTMILSGFYMTDIEAIGEILQNNNLIRIDLKENNLWIAIRIIKNE